MKRINVHLTPRQEKQLKDEADITGLKRAEIIRRAIDKYLTQGGT